MKPELIQNAFSDIDDRYVVDSHPDTVLAAHGGRSTKTPNACVRFLNSGWGAAAISGVVALAVLGGIVAAGQVGSADGPADNPANGPAGNPASPGYTAPESADGEGLSPSLDAETFLESGSVEIDGSLPVETNPHEVESGYTWAEESTMDPDEQPLTAHIALYPKGNNDPESRFFLTDAYLVQENKVTFLPDGIAQEESRSGVGALAQLAEIAPELQRIPLYIHVSETEQLQVDSLHGTDSITGVTVVSATTLQAVDFISFAAETNSGSYFLNVDALADAIHGDHALYLVFHVDYENFDDHHTVNSTYEYPVFVVLDDMAKS